MGVTQMGARQLMMFIFYYTAESPGRKWNCAVDIKAYCRADANAKFAEHMHGLEPTYEGMTVKIKPHVEVEAVPGPMYEIYYETLSFDGQYLIQKATDREGKRHRKKWRVLKGNKFVGYFSSKEKAARWVVLDA